MSTKILKLISLNSANRISQCITSQTTKAVKVIATDKSNNQTEQSFNVLIKPLKDKYHVTSSSTIQNPIRISSIRNGTTLTQTEKNTVINSLTITNNEP